MHAVYIIAPISRSRLERTVNSTASTTYATSSSGFDKYPIISAAASTVAKMRNTLNTVSKVLIALPVPNSFLACASMCAASFPFLEASITRMFMLVNYNLTINIKYFTLHVSVPRRGSSG